MDETTHMKLLLIVSNFIAVICFFSCGMAPQKSVSSSPTPTPTPNGEWRVYTPPDKSFSVELTCEPKQTSVSEPSTPIYQYACGLEESVGPHFFVIVVFNADFDVAKSRDEAAFERSVKDSLTPNKRLIKLIPIKVEGGIGREMIFTNTRDDMDNGRARVIIFGKHRYEILFGATDLKMLESPPAERFFATFKPLG
jgi:hypothetical protein